MSTTSPSTHTNSSAGGGIGFFGVLGILFIALKLIGTITWSWWWVLAPLWIPIAIVFVIFFLVLVGVVLFGDKK